MAGAVAVILLLAAICGGCVNVAVIGSENETTIQIHGAGPIEDRKVRKDSRK